MLQGLSQRDDCEVHVVSAAHKILPSPDKLAANIYFHSIKVPKLGWRASCYAGCIKAIKQKIDQLRPDIVHGQGTERYCALAAVFAGLPNVVTIHGNMITSARFYRAKPGSFLWFAAHLESFALRRTERVLCHSSFTESIVHSRTPKTCRVPNAIRLGFFRPLRTAQANTVPVILNIGTIIPHKRQVEVLEVGRCLHEAGYRFQMRFLGGLPLATSYGAEFKSLVERAEKDGFGYYDNTKDEAALLDCYDEADALIHSPRAEPFGLVVAEALSRNLKFFGSREGGVIDIADGIDGTELHDPDDWDALFHGIARWISAGHKHPQKAAEEMARRVPSSCHCCAPYGNLSRGSCESPSHLANVEFD